MSPEGTQCHCIRARQWTSRCDASASKYLRAYSTPAAQWYAARSFKVLTAPQEQAPRPLATKDATQERQCLGELAQCRAHGQLNDTLDNVSLTSRRHASASMYRELAQWRGGRAAQWTSSSRLGNSDASSPRRQVAMRLSSAQWS
ncbi:hypothetical protein K523DRAFT_323066 [Schizophyllum commune Tattone D]|nr:hypothetical protein K523DRAFT_323066 [Schizophyllum commune Tattone D]